eukprot:1152133-Pelagomonas_calceolata.AAC.1
MSITEVFLHYAFHCAVNRDPKTGAFFEAPEGESPLKDQKLRPDGELLLVTLPRPLGIVFEYDERRKQAIVVDLVGVHAVMRCYKPVSLAPWALCVSMTRGRNRRLWWIWWVCMKNLKNPAPSRVQ